MLLRFYNKLGIIISKCKNSMFYHIKTIDKNYFSSTTNTVKTIYNENVKKFHMS